MKRCVLWRWLFAAAVMVAASGNGRAADLPEPGAPPVAPAAYAPAPPPFSWTGFYMGGNVGYSLANASQTVTGGGLSITGNETLDGIVGGVQAGTNYQFGMAVLGVEADFDGSSQSYTTNFGGGVSQTDRIPWLGTARVRLGVALDRFLVYGTGGAGWGEFASTVTFPGFGSSTATQTHSAWVAGVGAEYAITNNLTARVEYLYFDTGNIALASFPGVTNTGRVQDSVVRFGANYKLP
jgi:outer membrane immunogenic protein